MPATFNTLLLALMRFRGVVHICRQECLLRFETHRFCSHCPFTYNILTYNFDTQHLKSQCFPLRDWVLLVPCGANGGIRMFLGFSNGSELAGLLVDAGHQI